MSKLTGKEAWSIPTWYLFHGLAEKININFFNNEKDTIIKFYKLICQNLPCPICQHSATLYLKQEKFEKVIKTKEDLINFLYNMHNWVNKKLKKKEYSKSGLEKYKRINIKHCIRLWVQRFFRTYHVHNNFNNWRRNMIMEDVKKFFLTKYKTSMF